MVGTIMASMMTSALSRIVFWAAPIGPCGSKMPKSQPERLTAAATAATGLATFNGRPHLSRRTKHGFRPSDNRPCSRRKRLADLIQQTYRAAKDFHTASAYIGVTLRHRRDGIPNEKAFAPVPTDEQPSDPNRHVAEQGAERRGIMAL